MIIDNWREILYPLGFLSSLAFGSRVLLQWVQSEIKKESIVTKQFWQLSLSGNVLLMVHALIQLQFHVCVVQACNAVISWRNINLMSTAQARLKTVILLLIGAIVFIVGAFVLQGYLFFEGSISWFRIPLTPWSQNTNLQIAPFWHVIGFVGIILFASRFWVQWWDAERYQKSRLGSAFWWISLIGDLLCLFYFAQIQDPVNLIGPALGLIPYIRNLVLIHHSEKVSP